MVIEKDILSITEGIIGHQVNTQGVMGAGLALKIREKYPQVYEEYRKNTLSLGNIQVVTINPSLFIVNMAAQRTWGRRGVHTNYQALESTLKHLTQLLLTLPLPIYLPYKLGSGLAGGDWSIVYKLIETHCPSAIICKPPLSH